MKIYFSHPTFTYSTKTESKCIEIIKKAFKDDDVEVINPAQFGLRKNPIEEIKKADMMIGMAVSGKLMYLVWKELEAAEKFGLDRNIFYVENKKDLGPLVEGIPKDLEKLSKEESRAFSNDVIGTHKESFISMFIGNWGGRF